MSNQKPAPAADSFETIKSQPAVKAPPAKPILPPKPKPVPPPQPAPLSRPPAPSSGLDWLEQNMTQRRTGDLQAKKLKADQEKNQRDQLEKMKELDKKRSRQMYEEIQQQIMLIRKKKKADPAKYITAAAGYDQEQHQDPESFWDKMKKKQAEAKKKLPWTSKQGMGTGEISRGVSG